MKKAVIYLRVSSLKQNHDRQILELTSYSEEKKLEIVKTFSDTISASKKRFNDREQFNLMIEYINHNQIRNILVSEISRISRQFIDTLKFIEYCNEKLINIYFRKENISTLDTNGAIDFNTQVIIVFLSAMAKQETDTLSYRIKSGKQSQALKGNSYHGRLYGYDKVDGRPVINEEEAVIVRKMFEMLLQGFGCQKIANYLNEYENVQKVWLKASVYSIVTNPFFMGKRQFKDLKIPVDAIVTEQLFNEAQAFIKGRFRFVSDSKHINPFASFIFCACGQTFIQTIVHSNRTNLYKCRSSSCRIPSINRPYLIAEVKSLLENNTKLTKDKEERAKLNVQIKMNELTVKTNIKKLSKIEISTKNNYYYLTTELINKSAFEEVALKNKDEKLKLIEQNFRLIELNKGITNILQNEILHYDEDLEVFKKQIFPIIKKIVIGEKHCTIHMIGFSMMYFPIYRGKELLRYRNHLKKYGKTVEFKPSLEIDGLEANTQMLLDNHLDSNPY